MKDPVSESAFKVDALEALALNSFFAASYALAFVLFLNIMTINVWGKLEIMSRIEGVNNFNLPRVNKENVLFARSAIG